MGEKSFVTCFDKECNGYAELLMTLVSTNENIKNVKLSREVFGKNTEIVSGEYILTIGEKSSEINCKNFPQNKYDAYGIQIGIYGHKAWIVCKDIEWNDSIESEFVAKAQNIFNNLKMNTTDTNKRIEEFSKRHKEARQIVVRKKGNSIWLINVLNDIQMKLEYSKNNVQKFITDIFKKSARRELQYKFAIALFYQEYIEDFLLINEEPCEELNL